MEDYWQLIAFLLVLVCLIKPLSHYLVRVLWATDTQSWAYRLCVRLQLNPEQDMPWRQYAAALLGVQILCALGLYALTAWQAHLPLNPQALPAVGPDLGFNNALSFITATGWQAYAGENTLSYGVIILGTTVAQFVGAASGIAVLLALGRAFKNDKATGVGHVWLDLLRPILYVLLPLALILGTVAIASGVAQDLQPYRSYIPLERWLELGNAGLREWVPMGPIASQAAIKNLTNTGGGLLSVGSAHPLENPSPLLNFCYMLAMILLPASLCYSWGIYLQARRQALAFLCLMGIVGLGLWALSYGAEQHLNAAWMFDGQGLSSSHNMLGKEQRFGILNSSLWSGLTSATSSGSTNAAQSAFMPLSILAFLLLMQLGGVIFGGGGAGLASLLMLFVIAVFLAYLLIGRIPVCFNNRLQGRELILACLVVFVPPVVILLVSAWCVGPHNLTEMLYAISSCVVNNGSAMSGLKVDTPFYQYLLGGLMALGRWGPQFSVLAFAGGMAQRRVLARHEVPLRTDTPLFMFWLLCAMVVLQGLAFFPALLLGPILEHLRL